MRSLLYKILSLTLFVTSCFYAYGQPVFDFDTQQATNSDFVSVAALEDIVVEDLGSFSVNTLNRDETRSFFNAIYMISEDIKMDWTGDYFNLSDTATAAGDVSQTFRLATLLRVNYFRAMAGIPADIVFHSDMNTDCQLTAIIMSGNDGLSHFPENDGFPNYLTSIGDETAAKSNIAIGSSGPDAIVGYMRDKGATNYKVGHRRWILYPIAYKMGSGDTPEGDAPESILSSIETFTGSRPQNDLLREANSLLVLTDFATRPVTAWPFVSYPAPGYIPYQTVYPRWSFSIEDADFSNATVEMSRNGDAVAVEIEELALNIGDNTLAWIYDNQNSNESISHSQPDVDTEYIVTVSNIANAPSSTYTYTVTVFDPAVPGDDYIPTAIIGSIEPLLNTGNEYSIQTSGDWMSQYQWRSFELEDVTKAWNAENNGEDLSYIIDDGFDIIQSEVVSEGSNSYHFIQIGFNNQYLIINTEFAASENSSLSFDSRLRAMSEEQYAEVQISLDGGISWNTLDSQQGMGTDEDGFVVEDKDFIQRSFDLSDYAGKTFHLRFGLVLKGNSAFIGNNPHNLEGWFFDDITLTDVRKTSSIVQSDPSTGSTFSFTPITTTSSALQAQGIIFDEYGLERGPFLEVTAISEINTPPIATEDSTTIQGADTSTSGNILDNDSDLDPDTTLTIKTVNGNEMNLDTTLPLDYGSITVSSDGDYTYNLDITNQTVANLNDGETLTEVITYSISDSHETVGSTLTITIEGYPNNAPKAEADIANIDEGVPTVNGNILENDSDVDADTTLSVRTVNDAESNVGDTILLDYGSITTQSDGNFVYALELNNPNVEALNDGDTLTESISYTVSDGRKTAVSELTITINGKTDVVPFAELINISTRGKVQTGDSIMIGGFVIEGNDDLELLVQGVGSELSTNLAAETLLANPYIAVLNAQGEVVAENDNWDAENEIIKSRTMARLGATQLSSGSQSSALIQTFSPGIYTVFLYGVDASEGIALIEIYNASDHTEVDSELINISTRGDVGSEDEVMIGGFVIEGNTNKNVLIQGVAQELSGIAPEALLPDPVILVVNSAGDVIASNDDWASENKEIKIQAGADLGATPLENGSASSALYIELSPGVYTVILAGIEEATGIALIEAYIAP